MAEGVKIIKTLPHLSKIFLPENEISAFSHIYNKEIFEFLKNLKILHKNEITYQTLKNILFINNFSKVNSISNRNEFIVLGDIVTFWPIGYEHPIRAEFFGDEIEKLYLIDELYNTKLYDQNYILISESAIENKTERDSIEIKIPIQVKNLNLHKFIFIQNINIVELKKNNNIINTDFTLPPLFYSKFELFERELNNLENKGYKVIVKSGNIDNLPKSLNENNKELIDFSINEVSINVKKSTKLPAGFISELNKIAVFTEREIFGSIYLTRRENKKNISGNIQKLLHQFEGTLEIGDFVVHEDYGIGIYSGLTQEKVDGIEQEYILIKYDKGDELYVPLNQLEKITKYIGPEGVSPKITRLGRVSWELIKQKVKKSAGLLAKDLVTHYAKRELATAKEIDRIETKEYREFVDEFEYRETGDQLRATNEILADLEKKKPMDRLLVGDVGFGKTEVIMRTAFKVVENGGQVAVLSPTTVLTDQHYEVFSKRFKKFPISIGYVSRFKSPKENSKIIDEANEGKVDILIGTHRILSNDVRFKNLQLIVVDEEQRFGVKQKEKIKQVNYSSHLLSVSATPIPRTLSMALSSIQSLSIISTPPINRMSIKTEILKNDWGKAVKSIIDEVKRGGQIYFIHNEVQTINSIKTKLEFLAPGVKFAIAHGQMSGSELDRVMSEFYKGNYDCLISTTIVENGLDIPNVNTIIINKAHRFGLSQLYQLRGRVGRSGEQAYCYLLYEGRDLLIDKNEFGNLENRTDKRKIPSYLTRLQSLVDNQDLGAGFRIASRDLEIRGAGNLLGEQQSGHISTIGYALYIEILAEEIERLRNISNL